MSSFRSLRWLLLALVAVVVLVVLRPRSTPSAPGPTGIATLEWIQLGEVEQLVLTRGADQSAPVVLFLHGGPGASVMPGARWMHAALEQRAIVVHWDQRGSASSCDIPPGALTLVRLATDAEELIEILRQRHGVEKVGVIGASWGSILGLTLAQRRPDRIWAYVGEGQVVSMGRGEAEALQFARAEARRRGDTEAEVRLAGLEAPLSSPESVGRLRRELARYRGIWFDGAPYLRLMASMLLGPEHTAMEKLRALPCMARSARILDPEIRAVDFDESVSGTGTPTFFFQGRHDYLAPPQLLQGWAEGLGGDGARVVWFDQAGHVPSIEQPERWIEAFDRWVLPHAQ